MRLEAAEKLAQEGISAEVIDLIVNEDHRKICGQKIKDIPFPQGVIISSIDRNDDVIIPNGEDVVQPGDRITIFVGKRAVRKWKN